MSGTDPVKSFDTLDVQVKALEGEVRDIKTSITNLASEVRSALTSITTQFAQQQRTPWMAIGSILSVVMMVAGFMAYQTLNPITDNIKYLKDNSFPKEEAIFRYSVNDHRLTNLEAVVTKLEDRRYDEMMKRIDELRAENRALRNK